MQVGPVTSNSTLKHKPCVINIYYLRIFILFMSLLPASCSTNHSRKAVKVSSSYIHLLISKNISNRLNHTSIMRWFKLNRKKINWFITCHKGKQNSEWLQIMNIQKHQHEANYSLKEQLTELICPWSWYYFPEKLMLACLPADEREVSYPVNTGGQNYTQLIRQGQSSCQVANCSPSYPKVTQKYVCILNSEAWAAQGTTKPLHLLRATY